MKKIINSILLIVFLLLPAVVKADMSAPIFPDYDLKVINKNGAIVYEEELLSDGLKPKSSIDFGTVVNGDWEITYKGEDYIYVYKYEGYIKLKDLSPVDQVVSPNRFSDSMLSTPIKARVNATEAVLRTGPGEMFDEVARVKKDTIGTITYIVENYYYVEFNGQKGWVDALGKTILKYNDNIFITSNDIKTFCGTIPVNTIFTESWEGTQWDAADFYTKGEGSTLVKYNNCETFINTFKDSNIVTIDTNIFYYAVTKNSVKVYEKPDFKKVIGTIPAGELLTTIRSSYVESEDEKQITYVVYNDLAGWIPSDDDINKYFDSVPGYDASMHTKANNKLNEYIAKLTGNPTPDPIPEPASSEKPTTNPSGSTTTKKDSKDILIACCIGACAFALGAIAAIILVNRKKDKNEVKEETPTIDNNEIKKE